MRIAINAQAAVQGASGIGQFAGSAVQALALSSKDRVLALRGSEPLGITGTTIEERAVQAWGVWEQFQLPAVLDRWCADVYFSPLFVAPLACNVPVVVTVHDAIPITHPDLATPEFLGFWQRWLAPSLRAADHIATVSDAARQDLIERASIPPARVSVVRQAVSPRFRPRQAAETGPVLDVVGLEHDRYLLYLGSIEPRKNIAHLVRAFLALDTQLPLALAGHTTHADAEIASLVRSADPARIRHLGPVPDEHAAALMAGARAFVFVSRAEGFGRPVLEAMASGVPVLASRIAPHAELAGPAAHFADPNDETDITRGIDRVLRDDDLRQQLRSRGIARAAEFTADRFAADLRTIFANVVRR